MLLSLLIGGFFITELIILLISPEYSMTKTSEYLQFATNEHNILLTPEMLTLSARLLYPSGSLSADLSIEEIARVQFFAVHTHDDGIPRPEWYSTGNCREMILEAYPNAS